MSPSSLEKVLPGKSRDLVPLQPLATLKVTETRLISVVDDVCSPETSGMMDGWETEGGSNEGLTNDKDDEEEDEGAIKIFGEGKTAEREAGVGATTEH